MAKTTVNLDAHIKREDFLVESDQTAQTPKGGNMKLSELEETGIVYQMLRKPDFQRETANWTPEKVGELVRGFLDGELIPSIIMWRSPKSGNIFVIDGAHRLSALIAWVHDDYGDKQISIPFFGNILPQGQIKAAEDTRNLINNSIGSYRDIKHVAQHQGGASPLQLSRAKNAGVIPIEMQWVTGDGLKAEASFFTINMGATVIDKTELEIIKARKKPNAIAARALIRSGTGHKYWSDFPDTTKIEIEAEAKTVYDLIHFPEYNSPWTSPRTVDTPRDHFRLASNCSGLT